MSKQISWLCADRVEREDSTVDMLAQERRRLEIPRWKQNSGPWGITEKLACSMDYTLRKLDTKRKKSHQAIQWLPQRITVARSCQPLAVAVQCPD